MKMVIMLRILDIGVIAMKIARKVSNINSKILWLLFMGYGDFNQKIFVKTIDYKLQSHRIYGEIRHNKMETR